MTVRIPISGDSGSLTSAIDRIRDAIRKAGQEAKAFADIDLSHPEIAKVSADLRGLQENVQRLVRDARGPSAAAARAIYDGSTSSVLGPNGLLSPGAYAQRFPESSAAARHHAVVTRYVTTGTGAAPSAPPVPMGPSGGAGAGGGGGGGIQLGGLGASATTSAMNLMRGFLPGMLALAGLQRMGAMAGQAVGQASDEAQANDRLMRTLRDLDTGFDGLRTGVRDATRGLGLTYQEAQQLAASWSALTNATDAATVTGNVRFAAGFARGYGLDPGQVTAGFGRAAYMGEDPRRFAGILADAISQSGQTGRAGEALETLLRFQEQNARRMGPANALDLFAGAYATLSSSGIPGLRGQGAEAVLSSIDTAVQQGGAAGEASQFLTWRALSRHGNGDVFRQQYALAGGMFTGVDGGAAGPGNPTIYEAMQGEINRLYPGDANRFRRYLATSRHFGINPRTAESLEGLRGTGDVALLGRGLASAGISIADADGSAFRDVAEVQRPGADLNRWRQNVMGRLPASDPRRGELERASGEDLRNALVRALNDTGRQQTEGSRIQESMAEFSNALTRTGTGLLPVLTDMRDAITSMVDLVANFSESSRDFYLAFFQQDPEALARIRSRSGRNSESTANIGGGDFMSRLEATESGAAGADAVPRLDNGQAASSARGWHQWTEPTWLSVTRRFGQDRIAGLSREQILDLRRDREFSREMLQQHTRRDLIPQMARSGVTASELSVYAGLHFGAGGGARVMRAEDDERMADIVGPEAVAANPYLANLTAGQWRARFGSRFSPRPLGAQVTPTTPAVPGTPIPAGAGSEAQPQQQSSIGFSPLRVIVENSNGETMSDQFLGLDLQKSFGAPVAHGVG